MRSVVIKKDTPRPYHIAGLHAIGLELILLSAIEKQKQLIFYTHLKLVCRTVVPRNHKTWRETIRIRARQLGVENEEWVKEALVKLLAEEKEVRKKRAQKERSAAAQNAQEPVSAEQQVSDQMGTIQTQV